MWGEMLRLFTTALVASSYLFLTSQPLLAASLTIRAGIIKGDGRVVPVARTLYTLTPSAGINTKEEYLSIARKLGLKEPDPEKYFIEKPVFDGMIAEMRPNTEKFEKDTYAFYAKIVESKKPKDVRTAVTVRTSLTGEAIIEDIAPGEWDIYGTYRDNFTSLTWARRFVVGPGRNVVELANDNSDYNFWPVQVPTMRPAYEELTEKGEKYVQDVRSVLAIAKEEVRLFGNDWSSYRQHLERIAQADDAKLATYQQANEERNRERGKVTWIGTLAPLAVSLVGFALPKEQKTIAGDQKYQYEAVTPLSAGLVWGGLGLSALGYMFTGNVWEGFNPKPKSPVLTARSDYPAEPQFTPRSPRVAHLYRGGLQAESFTKRLERLERLGDIELIKVIKTEFKGLDADLSANLL